MDKIKKALDKARIQRESGASSKAIDRGNVEKDLSSIKYVQTKTLDVPRDVYYENRLINAIEQNEYTDSIKLLRTQVLQRMDDNNWNVLGVTSARRGEGKSLISLNLGISIAMEVEYTVLVIDVDLRQPSIHKYFGLNPKYGLSDYLRDDKSLNEMLINPGGIDHFVILPGGRPMHNSAEMLASPKMGAMVEEIKHRYPRRIIIFDMPPVLGTADTVAFAPYVDATLVVVEDGVTSANDLKRATGLLGSTNIIGSVLNKSNI